MLLLACFAAAVDSSISLTPPLQNTNISEIGNWTLGGVATNMKRFIRLTADAAHQEGYVCSRVPTMTRDWSLEIEIATHKDPSKSTGHGFKIYFAKEVCQPFVTNFTGFLIDIDTRKVDKDGKSPVFLTINGNRTEVGRARVRNQTLILHLSRYDDRLIMDTAHSYKFERVFELYGLDIVGYGYFTIASKTSPGEYDKNDLLAVRYYSMPQKHTAPGAPDPTVDWANVNRKIIDNSKRQRKYGKMQRRKAMPVAFDMFEKTKQKNLDGKDRDLRNAFKIVSEAHGRAQQDISIDKLNNMINTKVESAVDSAYRKIVLAASRFQETSTELNELWSDLRTQLLDIGVETNQAMANMRAEFEGIVKNMKITDIDAALARSKLSQQAETVDTSVLDLILAIIAIIEGVSYVIFFFYKRSKTGGFKKID